jgi:segregation and condensation protein A
VSFEIKLPLFEGPFDLLLFFIERDELDIYDIPISSITNEFLAYLKQLEHLNIEVASEFILVAATLMSIKAKMLLPRPQISETGELLDPRDELVKHLLEYKKFKSVVGELANMEADRLTKEKRGNLVQELKKLSETNNVEAELQDIDLYKLLKVFEKVMGRYEIEQKRQVHTVEPYPHTIENQKIYLLEYLLQVKRLSFTDMLEHFQMNRIVMVFNFLAVLEMLQLQQVKISIGEGFNNFWIERIEASDLDVVAISNETE